MEVITIFRFSDYSHLSDELLFWPQTHFTGRANVDDLGYSNKNSNVLNMPQSHFIYNLSNYNLQVVYLQSSIHINLQKEKGFNIKTITHFTISENPE